MRTSVGRRARSGAAQPADRASASCRADLTTPVTDSRSRRWQGSTGVGIFLGAQIPASWGLDFALPLTFIALVVPGLKDRAGVLTAIVASLAALLFFSLPFKLGLIASAFVAIAAGLWSEKK